MELFNHLNKIILEAEKMNGVYEFVDQNIGR